MAGEGVGEEWCEVHAEVLFGILGLFFGAAKELAKAVNFTRTRATSVDKLVNKDDPQS